MPLKNPPIEQAEHVPVTRGAIAPAVRRYVTPHTLSPRGHLLSNGSYSVMVTNAGGGYSRRQNLAMTRWREDMTTDEWGNFCFVRDLDSGAVWSTTHQPVGRDADEFEVTFALDRAMFRRVDGGLETRTEIVVSTEDDVELRRISITNHGRETRSLDLTSYAEVVLAPAEADLAHPAFSNLFIETSALPERDALICARRPRSGGARTYLFHLLSGRGRVGPATQFETNRARFVGRGRTLMDPIALATTDPLSNTTGPVLDPIVALRQFVRLPPGGTARVAFITGFAESEEDAHRLVEKYHDRRAVARALALAGTHSQIELRHFGLTIEDTILFQRLAGRLLYADPRLRAGDAVQANRRGQPELWKYGISGDIPMLVARFTDGAELPLFRDLLKAHEFLRAKGLTFDLVVLNEHGAGYRQDLQESLMQMLQSSPEQGWADKPGGVFLRRSDLMPPDDQTLLKAAARAVMDASQGGLNQQLVRPLPPIPALPARLAPGSEPVLATIAPPPPTPGRSPRSTASADSSAAARNTPSRSIPPPVRSRRRRGSTSSPTRRSALPPPTSAWVSRGPRTATTTACRRGATTRSAIRPARRSSCATTRTAACGRRRRCRRVAAGRTPSATARATPSSSTRAPESPPPSGSSCRATSA